MKRRWQKRSERSGFTLVETTVSLLIFSLAILIISLTLFDVRHRNYHNLTTQFYSYLSVIEDQNYRLKRCEEDQLTLTKAHKIYYINYRRNQHQLIMTTNKGGYILLMDHVKSVNWHEDNGAINQHIVMMTGEQFNGKSRFR